MMEFQDVVTRRQAVSGFLDRPVDPAAVDRILDCGRRGPSAGFSQGIEFLVLEGAEQTGRYRARHGSAPVLIFPVAHKQAYLDRYAEPDKGWTDRDEEHWPVPYWLVDTAFAAQLILLAAVDQGLEAVFSIIEDVDAFRQAFGVPAEFFPIGAIVIGHPASESPAG